MEFLLSDQNPGVVPPRIKRRSTKRKRNEEIRKIRRSIPINIEANI